MNLQNLVELIQLCQLLHLNFYVQDNCILIDVFDPVEPKCAHEYCFIIEE